MRATSESDSGAKAELNVRLTSAPRRARSMRRLFRFAGPLAVAASLVAVGGERFDSIGGAAAAAADRSPSGAKHGGRAGRCPPNMARVNDFCIDRFEAPNRRGEKPLVMQSAKDAETWCAARSKRLCTEDEWIDACAGDEQRSYPYGAAHVDGRCNDDKTWRKVDEATLAKWPAPEARSHANDLYQAEPSGERRQCVSAGGVHDLTGNVEEWVVRTREHANSWPFVLIGCYWAGCYGGNKPTCHSTNNAHGPDFRYYETGFRCCRDLDRVEQGGAAAEL